MPLDRDSVQGWGVGTLLGCPGPSGLVRQHQAEAGSAPLNVDARKTL
ncbi:MAG: hypothetical protein H7210_11135 [Pyrinomonadaceae bacterium]|nr:hypothetical protein [Phycisphaerales bacterium]